MTSVVAVEHITSLVGAVLIAAGLNVAALRRHLVSILLGAQTTLLGAVLLAAARPDSPRAGLAAALAVGGVAVVPLALAAFAHWRGRRGSADVATLQEADGVRRDA